MTKRERVLQGEKVIMSSAELDQWIADDMPENIVSVPNMHRVGLLDEWIVYAKNKA